jgi:hypothetical protein
MRDEMETQELEGMGLCLLYRVEPCKDSQWQTVLEDVRIAVNSSEYRLSRNKRCDTLDEQEVSTFICSETDSALEECTLFDFGACIGFD